MSRELHEATEDALQLLPPFLRQDPTIQGTTDAVFRELVRIQEAGDELRENFYPYTAEQFLGFWEALFNLSAVGKTIEQRRESVLNFLSGLSDNGYGSSWTAILVSIAGSSVQWAVGSPVPDYTVRITIPLDSNSPAAGELERLLRVITPANLDLEIFYDEGWILGVSRLGEEAL